MLAANMKPKKRNKNPRRRRTLGGLFGAVMSMRSLPRTHRELFLFGHSREACSQGDALLYAKQSPLYGTKRTKSRRSANDLKLHHGDGDVRLWHKRTMSTNSVTSAFDPKQTL